MELTIVSQASSLSVSPLPSPFPIHPINYPSKRVTFLKHQVITLSVKNPLIATHLLRNKSELLSMATKALHHQAGICSPSLTSHFSSGTWCHSQTEPCSRNMPGLGKWLHHGTNPVLVWKVSYPPPKPHYVCLLASWRLAQVELFSSLSSARINLTPVCTPVLFCSFPYYSTYILPYLLFMYVHDWYLVVKV